MGATSTHKPAGQKLDEYFANYFSQAEIVASSSRRAPGFTPGCGDWQYEYYAAVRYIEPHPNAGEVFAFVVLYTVSPSSYYNFTYKDMDETVLPFAANPSRAVLEALTPTDWENANTWRAQSWSNLERTEAKPRVRRGSRVRFPSAFTFGDGLQTTTETVFEVDERDTLRIAQTGQRVRIPRWRQLDYSLVA